MPTPAQPKVAVSYAWKEERGGDHANAVDTFCEQLRGAGIDVIRDSDRLKHGECISAFMRSIGASDFLCVFLSDAYLKSPNCMYELLVAWQRSRDNADEFRSRVKVWVMPGAEGIHKTERRLSYLKHWKSERDRLTALIQEAATDGLATAELESFRRIKQFAEHVNEMLCFFADTLSPQSADEFQKWIQEQFSDALSEPTEHQLAQVYENTVAEMETLLNGNPRLRQFFSSTASELIHEVSGQWKLTAGVRARKFDVSIPLDKVRKGLATFSGPAGDWLAVEEFVGGLVVLAINPQWVSKQKAIARSGSTDYPALEESVAIGGGRTAYFLHLVTSALGDGRARLEKVFGKPTLDEFRMPEPAYVTRGISEPDIVLETKLHFIRHVLGPQQEVKPDDAKQIATLFTNVKAILSTALNDDHTAFFATGDAYKKLSQVIREHLQIQDLLLIHPSGDESEGHILTDHIRVLRFLGQIFDTVKARTSP